MFKTLTTANPATLFGAAMASTSASVGAEIPPTMVSAANTRNGIGVNPASGYASNVMRVPAIKGTVKR